MVYANISGTSNKQSSESSYVISNSYNSNYYNNYPEIKTYSHDSVYHENKIVYDNHYINDKKEYCEIIEVPYETSKDKYEYLKFDYRIENKKIDVLFSNNAEQHNVYVRNKDDEEGLFTVKFYFSVNHGDDVVESRTLYIKPWEERKFTYQTIYADRYSNWDYEVISESKSIEKENEIIKYKQEERCYLN